MEEVLPKALTEIERSINKLRKCYFSLYRRKGVRSEASGKMDVDVVKKAYFECFHRESNDITELYNFYRQQRLIANESSIKAKTFRNSEKGVKLCPGSDAKRGGGNESLLSQQLRKICKGNGNNPRNEKTLSLSGLNKSLFNQKLNFINLNLAPTTAKSFMGNCRAVPQVNARSLEKIQRKAGNSNVANNAPNGENCSLETVGKINDVERRKVEIERIISPSSKKSSIFSSLPAQTQQRLLRNNSSRKAADFDKIREIAKLMKANKKPTKSVGTAGRGNTSQLLSFMESFFDKSELIPEQRPANLRNEEIDEKSFLEGLKHAADYKNFLGKDVSNDPSFSLQP